MEKMIDLFDLLSHGIKDLFSAEEQIIEGLPAMIENARNPKLVKALKDHLKVTKVQSKRLLEVQKLLNKENKDSEKLGDNKSGFFSRLFGVEVKCKAMEGLITEGEKLMSENMDPNVMDAAIIGCAQKIEHYEISGYGTARAYASELGLTKIESLLKQTLDEEYFADDSLTQLAVGKINLQAENHGAETAINLNRKENTGKSGKSDTGITGGSSTVRSSSTKTTASSGSESSNNTTRSSNGKSAASGSNSSKSTKTAGASGKASKSVASKKQSKR